MQSANMIIHASGMFDSQKSCLAGYIELGRIERWDVDNASAEQYVLGATESVQG